MSTEQLRKTLLRAAQDRFALVMRPRLGAALRQAADGALARLPEGDAQALATWRRDLDAFDDLIRDDREVAVARGLRLAAGMAQAPKPASKKPRLGSSKAPRPRDAGTVQSLPGIGRVTAARLAERGLRSVEDVAWLVPRRYDDMRDVRPLCEAMADVVDGDRVGFRATVDQVRFSRFRRPMVMLQASDGDARVTVRWFNAHGGMVARFPAGKPVALYGRIKQRAGAWEMANPEVVPERGGGIRARYPQIEGIAGAIVRKACQTAAERTAKDVVDGVPVKVAARVLLPPLSEALLRLHMPPPDAPAELVHALNEASSAWHRRLAFDELFFLALAVGMRGRERKADQALACVGPEGCRTQAEQALPFVMTGAQKRATDEAIADLARTTPMNRLLQGDVGSGKTAVAFVAAATAMAAGRQVAFMAPTELLAEQHARTLAPWADKLGIRVALLTSSTPKAVRESTLGLLDAGTTQLIVGTHALLSERVRWADLGLVIIDEQHRFGVAQRVTLRHKGQAPHLLVMTATPIPRTLALAYYGDLDVSILDELPPGRQPPVTHVLSGKKGRSQAWSKLRAAVARGERAFVVCPLITPSDTDVASGWDSVETVAAELGDLVGPVACMHGQMPAPERDRAMDDLRSGRAPVVVATTVVEVGVDVPEATVMIVCDADRFGLSQLHQLRGRVGRGGGASECLLMTKGARSSDAAERLGAMARTSSGFDIADEDLRIRGPGELLGERQAGLPRLRFGDLAEHTALLSQARQEADALLGRDPELALPEHAATRAVLDSRIAAANAFGAEGG